MKVPARPDTPGPVAIAGSADALYERHLLFDNVAAPDAAGPRQTIVAYEEGDATLGYARYRMKGETDHFLPTGKLRVDELIARTPAAQMIVPAFSPPQAD